MMPSKSGKTHHEKLITCTSLRVSIQIASGMPMNNSADYLGDDLITSTFQQKNGKTSWARGFCWVCFTPCGDDAHEHAMTVHGSYFPGHEFVQVWWWRSGGGWWDMKFYYDIMFIDIIYIHNIYIYIYLS